MFVFIKGDTMEYEGDFNEDITGYVIRCELYDDTGNSIKISSDEVVTEGAITITGAINGEFTIVINKNETTNFDDESKLEIEIQTNDSPTKLFTYKFGIKFEKEEIIWTDPNA